MILLVLLTSMITFLVLILSAIFTMIYIISVLSDEDADDPITSTSITTSHTNEPTLKDLNTQQDHTNCHYCNNRTNIKANSLKQQQHNPVLVRKDSKLDIKHYKEFQISCEARKRQQRPVTRSQNKLRESNRFVSLL